MWCMSARNPPHPAITAERLETLARLARGDGGIVIATVRGLLQRIPRPERLGSAVLHLKVGDDVDPAALRSIDSLTRHVESLRG